MAFDRDDSRWVFMPLSDVLGANGICQVIRDSWWTVCPERGLVFWQTERRRGIVGASPQCNTSESTARMLHEKLTPWASLEFVPLVLQPINPRDYA